MAGNQPIQLRCDRDTLSRIDTARGQLPRADYVRAALNMALDDGLRFVAGPRDDTHAVADTAARGSAPSPTGAASARGASGLADPVTNPVADPVQPGGEPGLDPVTESGRCHNCLVPVPGEHRSWCGKTTTDAWTGDELAEHQQVRAAGTDDAAQAAAEIAAMLGEPPAPMWDDDPAPVTIDVCAHCGGGRGMHQRGCPAS